MGHFANQLYPHCDVTKKVIDAAIEVHKTLGPGFMEKAYEEALALEFVATGIRYDKQRLVKVLFRVTVVDTHQIDMVVEGKVIVEPKAVKQIEEVHLAVTLAYLKATGLKVGPATQKRRLPFRCCMNSVILWSPDPS